MIKQITTPNMLEIAYLLDRQHQIVHVGTQAGWPYGIEEMAVTMEGENIDLDHYNFFRHGEVRSLQPLSKAMFAVQSVLAIQLEASAVGGAR